MQTTQNIVELFLDSSKKYPDQIAIIDKSGKAISYQELLVEVESRAAYLYKHGIRSGDQLLLCIPMGIDLFINILAIFYLGAIAVLPTYWSKASYLEQCAKLTDCRALIGIPKARLQAYFSKSLRKIPLKLESSSSGFKSIFPLTKVSADQAALITFSNGTNQRLLAEKRSHDFLFEEFQAQIDTLDPKFWEITLHHRYNLILAYLSMGASSIMADLKSEAPSRGEIDKLIQQLSLYKVNHVSFPPEILVKIALFLIENVQELPDIQRVYCEGRPISYSEALLLREAFPQSQIQIAYTLSEANPISLASVDEIIEENRSFQGLYLGTPQGNLEFKIIEIIDEPIQVPSQFELNQLRKGPRKIGEIIIHGHQVLGSYYNNLAAFERSKIVVEDKLWHRTGASGFTEGRKVFYTGACKSLILHGEKLYSQLIYEDFLKQFHQVETGTLLNIDGKLTLIIELKKESDQEKVASLLRHASIRFEQIIFMKKMPRTSETSAIDYAKLQDLLTSNKTESALDI